MSHNLLAHGFLRFWGLTQNVPFVAQFAVGILSSKDLSNNFDGKLQPEQQMRTLEVEYG